MSVAAYPRLQGYWEKPGMYVRILYMYTYIPGATWVLGGVGIQGTPYQKLGSLRIWPTIFRKWPNIVYEKI